MSIGKRISELRVERKLSQEYIAEKLNISRQAVSKWENDLSIPDTNNLIELSRLFDVSVEYLLIGDAKVSEENSKIMKVSKALKRICIIFFSIALFSHLYGIVSGEFTDNLIPIFPYLFYGNSRLAILLNASTLFFSVGWITLFSVIHSLDR